MARKPKLLSTYRLSELTRKQIKDMADGLEISEADVVCTAANYLYHEFREISEQGEITMDRLYEELRKEKSPNGLGFRGTSVIKRE